MKKNRKDESEKTHHVDNNKEKEREKENIAFGVLIEEILDIEDILCVVDIKIINTAIVNILLVVQDSVMLTWIIDYGTSFHCTPYKECCLSFSASNFVKVYLGNNHACNIKELGVVRVAMENGQELSLNQVQFVPRIKNSLLSVG